MSVPFLYVNVVFLRHTGLESFFAKIKEVQTSLTPYKSYFTKEFFQPYNPAPKKAKMLTDQTRALYEKLLEIKANLDTGRLKLRERRLLAFAEHELKHFFGKPYENNYYTGKSFLTVNLFLQFLIMKREMFLATGLEQILNLLGNVEGEGHLCLRIKTETNSQPLILTIKLTSL